MVVVISLIVLIVASWLLALPHSKKGLTHVWRYLMLLVGALAPLAVVWILEKPAGKIEILPGVLLVAAIVPNAAAVSLAATGWQAALLRQHGVEEALDLTLLEPTLYFPSYSSAGSSSDDLIGGCLFYLVAAVISALFVLGVIVAGLFDAYLLPQPASTWRRSLRAALCFLYALPIMAGAVLVLSQAFA